MKDFSIGLDIHGVIDSYPEFFAVLTSMFWAQDYHIHIITGQEIEAGGIRKKLSDWGICYDFLFSVSDDLVEKGLLLKRTDKGPWFANEHWNKAKGVYCAERKINLHIDDSPIYGKHFTTPYMQVKSWEQLLQLQEVG
jgi:hypothetical protein